MKRALLTPIESRAGVVLVMLMGMIAAPSYQAETRTLTFKTINDVDKISFDPTKISESRLRELIVLSPFIVDYINDKANKNFSVAGSMVGRVPDKQLIALPLELCIAGDPAYSNCDTNDIAKPSFLHNAEVNLQKSKRGLSWVQHLDHPKELDSVVKFLEQSLSLSIWIEETRLKYYSTWDETTLKEVHHGIDPEQLCPETFRKLEADGSKEEKYRTVRFDWANCILRAIDRDLGPYPINAWNSFLQAFSITEEYKQKSPE